MPFTTQEFFEVFKNYNLSIFPIQIILNLLAVYILFLLFYKKNYSDKSINFILGVLWLWVGIVYHYIFFTKINSAANIFALFFILQGLIFIYFGTIKKNILYNIEAIDHKVISMFLVAYALVLYPLIGLFTGHLYPYNPTFGAPCPTTIFTFGIAMFSYKIKLRYLIIPFFWALLGFSAAFNFGVYEDVGLILSALIAISFIWMRNLKNKKIKAGTISV